jgi:7-cyano-7-deazaguanine synthase in queuosine biosynthesis
MKLICAPQSHAFDDGADITNVVLYGHADRPTRGSAGAAIKDAILKCRYAAAQKAWDFLSLALGVTAADLAGFRSKSPDGWTREFELGVAVADPAFWNTQRQLVERFLGFLTTDIWRVSFFDGGFAPKAPEEALLPPEDCVSLLSGGMDSFVGNLDLAAKGHRPFAVSQIVVGDREKQRLFAALMCGGLRHLQMNHNAEVPNEETPPSQRARSLIFLAYGVLAATMLKQHHDGQGVTLYVCENGFISINPPLTDMRLGSLSTRTTHPVFLKMVQRTLDAAGVRVHIENPYQAKTKGEMMGECLDQNVLRAYASRTTSCGRYLQNGFKHCGRCVPCLVRRAAFRASGIDDNTTYVYNDLGRDDARHARFDDVRSIAMALSEVNADGLEKWLGTALSTTLMGDVEALQAMVGRGLNELGALLTFHGVK